MQCNKTHLMLRKWF